MPTAKKTTTTKPRKPGRPKKAAVLATPKIEKEPETPIIKEVQAATPEPVVIAQEKKTGEQKTTSYIYAMGRRKTSSAKVKLFDDQAGAFSVNRRDFAKHFPTKELQRIVLSPLTMLGLEKSLSFQVYVAGGGIHSQAEAVRHGISRTLVSRNAEDKRVLKKAGFLTRDPRVKERKKPGLKRARRAPQWAKR